MSNKFWPLLETLKRKEKSWSKIHIKKGENIVSDVERDEATLWMCDVALKEKFGLDSLCLAIAILDETISISRVQSKYINCVALSSLYMAVKLHEELESIPDCVRWLQRLSAGYSRPELMRMERAILSKLNWDLGLPTVHRFLHLMLVITGRGLDIRMETDLWRCLQPLFTSHQIMYNYPPSLRALAAFSLALEINDPQQWFPLTVGLQQLFEINETDLISCREQLACLVDGEPNKENTVFLPAGYSTKKVGKRARKRQRRSSRSSESDLPQKFVAVEDIADALMVLYG